MDIYQYWIILGVIFMIAEIFTPGFILACFGFGSFGGSLFAYMGYDFKFQLLFFSLTTMMLFFSIRPLYQKYFHKYDDQRETGVNAYIGKKYKVTELIDNSNNTGRIQVGSESWRTRSINNQVYAIDSVVKVIQVEGSTLIVDKGE